MFVIWNIEFLKPNIISFLYFIRISIRDIVFCVRMF